MIESAFEMNLTRWVRYTTALVVTPFRNIYPGPFTEKLSINLSRYGKRWTEFQFRLGLIFSNATSESEINIVSHPSTNSPSASRRSHRPSVLWSRHPLINICLWLQHRNRYLTHAFEPLEILGKLNLLRNFRIMFFVINL